MVTLREIRIGNTLKDGVIDAIHGPAGEIEIINNQGSRCFVDLEFAEPLQISKDKLLKCGFVYHGNDIYVISLNRSGLKKMAIFKYFNSWGFGFVDCYGGTEKTETQTRDIYFWHEIENLFFALTGIELGEDFPDIPLLEIE